MVLFVCIVYVLVNGFLCLFVVCFLGIKLKFVENKLVKWSFCNVLIVCLFFVGFNLIINVVVGVLSVLFFLFIVVSVIGFVF